MLPWLSPFASRGEADKDGGGRGPPKGGQSAVVAVVVIFPTSTCTIIVVVQTSLSGYTLLNVEMWTLHIERIYLVYLGIDDATECLFASIFNEHPESKPLLQLICQRNSPQYTQYSRLTHASSSYQQVRRRFREMIAVTASHSLCDGLMERKRTRANRALPLSYCLRWMKRRLY